MEKKLLSLFYLFTSEYFWQSFKMSPSPCPATEQNIADFQPFFSSINYFLPTFLRKKLSTLMSWQKKRIDISQVFISQTAGGREAEWAEEPPSLHLCHRIRALLVRQSGYFKVLAEAGSRVLTV